MAKPALRIAPNRWMAWDLVWDATPAAVLLYAPDEKEALLARVRYNRLLDLFTEIRCCSIQSHLRTTLRGLGEVETDELYIGMDLRGGRYVLPVQARGPNDHISVVQVEQDIELCRHRYPQLICRPLGAQTLDDGTIALFEFSLFPDGIRVRDERHYRLVPPEELTPQDIEKYRKAADTAR